MAAVLGLGIVLGTLHGLLVTRLRLQPFIVTLCGLLLYRGMARYIAADHAGALFAIGSASLLPVIVLASVGAASSAHFYVVSLIAMATHGR